MAEKQTDKKKCGFCGMEIAPLDRHAHSVSPDKDAAENGSMLVTCIINRYYTVKKNG